MTAQPSTECPQIPSCPIGPIAVTMIGDLAIIKDAVANLPKLVTRVDSLEATRDTQKGWMEAVTRQKRIFRNTVISAIGFSLTICGFGIMIWLSVQKRSEALQVKIESIRSEAVVAQDTASDAQSQLYLAKQNAEAAAIERSNLANKARQNAARIRGMRSTLAQNSADIAAIPPPPAVTALKKHWYQP